MKLTNKISVLAAAGAMLLSLAACGGTQAADINELINSQLAQSGSGYSVSAIDADKDETVSLITEAEKAYDDYRNSLINTEKLAADLDDDGEAAAYINTSVEKAKQANVQTKANFTKSLDSFNSRGMNRVYVLSDEDIGGSISDENAVARYVASLIDGNAGVYVSDVIYVPALDDASGTYTGGSTAMRYVYVEYPAVSTITK